MNKEFLLVLHICGLSVCVLGQCLDCHSSCLVCGCVYPIQMTDGCDMGIKSLSRYLNEYEAADDKAKKIAKKLIDLENDLCSGLREYL